MKKRTIYNNPTKNPYCCKIECNKDGEFRIFGEGFGNQIDSCEEHLGYLVKHLGSDRSSVVLLKEKD